ncbi:MAG: universal stress protein [Planctomycetota bacterium]
MSCIVLTTDLSDESKRAFPPVVELAETLDLPITLLAVLEDLPFEPTGGGIVAVYPDRGQMHRDWDEKLQVMKAQLRTRVEVRAELVDAVDIPRAICEFAEQQQARYVAMATHGRSGLRRLLLGSVVEAVLRHSHVPVIAYPPPRS